MKTYFTEENYPLIAEALGSVPSSRIEIETPKGKLEKIEATLRSLTPFEFDSLIRTKYGYLLLNNFYYGKRKELRAVVTFLDEYDAIAYGPDTLPTAETAEIEERFLLTGKARLDRF